MKMLALATAAVLAVVSFSADAHGPTRRKVKETVEINAPAAKVWAVVGNFQDMSWLPPVEKTEGKGGNEVKATRTLTLKGGATVDEEQVMAFVADNVAPYKKVRRVEFIDAIPKSSSGKILRKDLRARESAASGSRKAM